MQIPKHLSKKSREFWREIEAENTLDAASRDLLTRYCEGSDRLDQVRAQIASGGLIAPDRFGHSRPNPLLTVERDLLAALARMWHLLGFDVQPPASKERG